MAKFGIEIECILSASDAVRALSQIEGINAGDQVCGYHDPRTRDFSKWRVERDSSVVGTRAQNYESGCEIVSPILDTETDGFEQIAKVVQALKTAGAQLNANCGLHVHLDARHVNITWMKNIIRRYSDNRTTIDTFMPPSRRCGGRQSNYCSPMSRFVNSHYFTSPNNIGDLISSSSRTYAVNITNHARLGTIEFRQHSGSLNAEKIQNWVTFLVAFMKASKPAERTVDSVPATGNGSPGLNRHIGTPLPNVYFRSNRERALWDALTSTGNLGQYHTLDSLSNESGYNANTVRVMLSRFRSYGMAVRSGRNGTYRCLNTPVVATSPRVSTREASRIARTTALRQSLPQRDESEQVTRGLWHDVPCEVQAYYQERIEDFQVNA